MACPSLYTNILLIQMGYEYTISLMITYLTHWGRLPHICIGNLTIIDSDNGLSPGRRQAIIWTNAGILLFWILRNKFQWNLNSHIFIQENAFESVVCEMVTILYRPQCVKTVVHGCINKNISSRLFSWPWVVHYVPILSLILSYMFNSFDVLTVCSVLWIRSSTLGLRHKTC